MKNIEKYIDHTLLKPDATLSQIETLCNEAREYGFFSVCVNPWYVSPAVQFLKGSDVKICTVIGFPLGMNLTPVKVMEAQEAILQGADEIDMVINIGALKSNNIAVVATDIAAVVKMAHQHKKLIKVIIETSLLTNEEKKTAIKLTLEAGADFVKTSTGFAGGGATVEDVQLMKTIAGDAMKIKASGGVRDLEAAKKMIEAGASRLGTSSGVAIIKGLQSHKDY